MIVIMALFTLFLAGVAFVVIKSMEKQLQLRGSLHPRRRARLEGKDWVRVMLEAFLKMFRDLDGPPPAPELTVQGAAAGGLPAIGHAAAAHSDPDMPGLPADARPRVLKINTMMAAIARRITGDPLGQPVIIEMEQMRDRHLPKLLRSYVEIPSEHKREIFAKTGKSASVHLCVALDAMVTRLGDIDKSLATENLDTFEDNARFISTTYGRGADPLD